MNNYRQIFKATTLFGGVQIVNILISIIRSKFIAILLGPTGMGITGLLTSTTGLISNLTNFGLGASAVKDVAKANEIGNKFKIATVVIVLRRLMWFTGTLGTLLVVLLSPWLSKMIFGNKEYTVAFILISITLLFNQLCSGQLVLLQGMRKLQYLAKANLSGNFWGLILTIPLYYRYGINAIIPAIIISSVLSLLFSWFFSKKIPIESIRVSKLRTLAEGKNMLIMGVLINLSILMATGASYFVRIFISNTGGIQDVGLYSAGFAIINTYVGLVFTAMGTDFYPRLSAVAHSNKLCKEAINQQAEIALLILTPIILFFLVFIKWIVILLYSNKFIAINEMILWAALGMIFKAASWAIAFILLAKGDSKLFFFNELIANALILGLNLLGYYYMGLTGLGVSFMIGYCLYLIQVFILAKIKYAFTFNLTFIRIFTVQLLLTVICFIIIMMPRFPVRYSICLILIIISVGYSWIELSKRLGLK